jgi:hypothetical protein
MNDWYLWALVVAIVGAFVLNGWRKIPADPPHIAALTRWGERTRKVKGEGWGFFPLYPLWHGYVLIKVEQIVKEFVSEETRTPDRATSRVPAFVTIVPDPDRAVEYLNSGGESGVLKQLEGKFLERIREWAMGPEEGPTTWIELNQSHLEGVSILIKRIAGHSESFQPIPDYAQDVPTWIWLRYTAQPRPTVFFENEKKWTDNNWQMVEDVITTIKNGPDGMANYDALIVALKNRRQQISDLSSGYGKGIKLPGLGANLIRLNIGNITVLGDVAKQAEGKAKEEQERQKEEHELKFVRERIGELIQYGYTKQEALEILQTERGKVTKTIDEKKITLDASTAGAIGEILGRIFK